MKPKPSCLGPEYAEQFADESVARAYRHRPPYPSALFTRLAALLPAGHGRVLDLGCGTGELARGLAPFSDHVDAVDPSAPILRAARNADPESPVVWHHSSAEDFTYPERYSLVVAGSSLHWMDLELVVGKISEALESGGFLAVVDRSRELDEGLREALNEIIPRHSTNRDYEPYETVALLTERGLFEESGRETWVTPFRQETDAFVESFHSQNGLSRDRMSPESAEQFDRLLCGRALDFAVDQEVPMKVRTQLVWGAPRHLTSR